MGVDTSRKEIFNLLFASYKSGNEVSTETIKAYTALLSDIPTPQLKASVVKCTTTCKYLPSIAEIREAAMEISAEVTDSRLKTFAEAWGEIEKNVKTVGYYGKPQWSAPEIEEAVKIIGWIELCTVEQAALNTMRAQFKGIYTSICERKQQRQHNIQAFHSLTASEKKQLNPAESFINQLAEQKSIKELEKG